MSIGGQNTAWKHGTNGATSTNTDFSAKTRALSINMDAETVDATVFGDLYKDYEQSFKNATIEVTYKYDATIWGQLTAIYNGGDTVTFELSPDGTTSGKPKITGSMFMTNFKPDLQIGNLEELPISWQVTGALTFASHS